jgi:DNA modification methylase
MTATIIRGDALHLPIADETVDLICTSPPYFGLRSYTDGGQHYDGQLGSEPTPLEYVDALIAATREMIRVLKPTGSIWVNLGDKYATSLHSYNYRDPGIYERQTPQPDGEWSKTGWKGQPNLQPAPQSAGGIGPKSLMGIPWRYALACIDQLGLILRAEIIWNKPNGLPESVTDRVRRSHEQWFHFVRQPRYYSAVDEVREPHTGNAHSSGSAASRRWVTSNAGQNHRALDTDPSEYNALGKLPGSVWQIPTEPLQTPPELGVDHFAAYPTEWPRRIIQGWTPAGICLECGQGRRPVSDKILSFVRPPQNRKADWSNFHRADGANSKQQAIGQPGENSVTITGYVCACVPYIDPSEIHNGLIIPASPGLEFRTAGSSTTILHPTRPAVVLDPFGGTGTTALVADVLGRHGISVDLSADYCRLARWRTTDPAQRARAARVDKPPPVIDGQLDLLGDAL